MANLRGGLFGVVDFAAFVRSTEFEFAPRGNVPVARTEQVLAESSLLVLSGVLGVNAALLVDSLSGLRGGDSFASVALPPVGAPSYFGKVYVDSHGARWQEINLQALSQYSPFLGISA